MNRIPTITGGSNSSRHFHHLHSDDLREVVKIHGLFHGSWLGIRRIFRCHPWGGFGDDVVLPKR